MAKRRIKDLTTTATAADLKSGNFFPLDGAEGTKKVPAELLKVPTTREIDGSVVSANQLEESGIYIVNNATQANYMTTYSKLLILVHKESDSSIYQHCFGKAYSMAYIGTRTKVNSSWPSSWEKMGMAADISGNAATATNATNATNADKVDGKHLRVLASAPDDYDTDSVYLIYGGN